MNILKCEVCGTEFEPTTENHYVSKSNGMFATYHDAFDCPQCGCQIVMQEREISLNYLLMNPNEYGTKETNNDIS